MINNLLSFMDVLATTGSIVIAVLVLLATITVHEAGHYFVGKIFKFKINEFAIGMGPAIFKRTLKSGEIFSVRLFPLGGFCAFEGEDENIPATEQDAEKLADENVEKLTDAVENTAEDNVQEKPRFSPNAFNNKKPWQRILVLIAGATMNFIFATIIVVTNFAIFGHTAYQPMEIMQSANYSESYSLAEGDTIRAINGRFIYMSVDIIESLNGKKKGDIVKVDVIRNGKQQTVDVMLRKDVSAKGLIDYDSVFSALGIGSVPAFVCNETAIFPNGEYLLKLGDKPEYKDCTRVYTEVDFFAFLATKQSGDKVSVWITDSTAESGKSLFEFQLGEGWNGVDKTDIDAQKQFFGIESVKYSYQINTTTTRLSFVELLFRPIVYGFKTIWLTFVSVTGLFNGSVPLNSVTGPIGTISITAEFVGLGLSYVLEIMALIGFSVGIFNLLPIPALDGARAVFVAIEWVRGKPIDRKIEGTIHLIGLFVLLGIAIFFDILQFI